MLLRRIPYASIGGVTILLTIIGLCAYSNYTAGAVTVPFETETSGKSQMTAGT